MEFKYFKQTMLDGDVIFVAEKIDNGSQLIAGASGVGLFARFDTSVSNESNEQEFTEAYTRTLEKMAMFLLSVNEVPTFPTCHKCGTPFPEKDTYFQKCKNCNPDEH